MIKSCFSMRFSHAPTYPPCGASRGSVDPSAIDRDRDRDRGAVPTSGVTIGRAPGRRVVDRASTTCRPPRRRFASDARSMDRSIDGAIDGAIDRSMARSMTRAVAVGIDRWRGRGRAVRPRRHSWTHADDGRNDAGARDDDEDDATTRDDARTMDGRRRGGGGGWC